MKEDNYKMIGGAVLVALFIMWKFPTFAMIVALLFSLSYAAKIVKINKERKENPDQQISYVTNIGNEKNKLIFDVRKAFAISIIILAISANFSTKAKNKNQKITPEPAKIAETQEETKKENKQEEVKQDPKEEAKEEPKEDNQEISNDDKKMIVESLIKAQFAEFFDTETETKDGIFYVYLYPKGEMANNLTYFMTHSNEPEMIESWKGVTDMLSDLSKQAKEQIDEEVSINIRNPLNEENVIYSNASGMEFYNIINDLNK